MNCNRKERRTVFELFKEYTCEDCKEHVSEECIKIGTNEIKIYYMGSCMKNYNRSVRIRKAKLLFKDIIIDSMNPNSKNLFLWLNPYDDLSKYYTDFEGMMNCGYHIYIIV